MVSLLSFALLQKLSALLSTRVKQSVLYTYSGTRLELGADSIQQYPATVSPSDLHPDGLDEQTRPEDIEFEHAST